MKFAQNYFGVFLFTITWFFYMPSFSNQSVEKLSTCHVDLQVLFRHVIQYFDCAVICGHRGKEDQDKAVTEGKSQRPWPTGNHNATPSKAVDVIPYPVDWNDRERMVYFGGFVMATAVQLKKLGIIGHDIRWGNDWNRDTQTKDNKFDDLPHFEIVE